MTSEIAPPQPPRTRQAPRHHDRTTPGSSRPSRSSPSILIDPLHEDFGWSRTSISSAVSINLVLYGLTSPFVAALMERFGMRRVVTAALILVSTGSGLFEVFDDLWPAHFSAPHLGVEVEMRAGGVVPAVRACQ
ncbi:MAG: MFS transporter [Rhodococcus sp. (in: high G+C Gram-positive bacteria)]|nr:MAG: MFS transporter [Rhodococcus sp. (in: high G+C Gram-positive bacteria)]